VRRPRRRQALPAALLGSGVAAVAAVATVAAGLPSGAAAPAAGTGSAAALVRSVDALRVRSGCRPLEHDDALRRSAKARAAALAEQGGVSHVDGVGGTAQDRAARLGYTGKVVELVAAGALRPDEFGAALVQLVNRTDLLDCRFRSVGAAVADRHLVMVLGDR
jgi:uncharacterized protein YkwD